MFIQFDAHCPTCRRGFKAEAEAPADGVPAGQFRCTCPRCHTAVVLRRDAGTPAAKPTGWALPAESCEDAKKA